MEVELSSPDVGGALRDLVGRLRGPDLVADIAAAVPHDVVITHDGKRLFAYAADEATLTAARSAIESVLGQEGMQASVRVSRWDDDFGRWHQTDPPASEQEQQAEDAARREADAIETRTLVVSSGKLVRAQVEASMQDWARRLGLECALIEHPHLLTTQVAFTVTGPRRRVQEFANGLRAQERATIRTETTVMLSPL